MSNDPDRREAGLTHSKACWRRIAVAALLLSSVAPSTADHLVAQDGAVRFAVVGHVRGNANGELHPQIDELVDELAAARPDLVFLTGDMIWGQIEEVVPDREGLEAQWDRLDARLDRLGVPIYRVPGNHDVHDPVSRDVFFERYGELPRVATRGASRFFLLNSTFTPTGDDPVPVLQKPGKAERLSSAQIEFLREALERESYEHDFLFMHHILWFYPDDAWWTEVHPLLVEHGVDAVFAGDLGPGGMFTHVSRDGIEYYRSTVNATAYREPRDVGQLLRSVQFESFIVVTADDRRPAAGYDVRALFGATSDAFAPERWHAAFGAEREPGRYFDPDTYRPRPVGEARREPGLLERAWDAVGSPRRLGALGAFGALCLALGAVIGRRVRFGRPTSGRGEG